MQADIKSKSQVHSFANLSRFDDGITHFVSTRNGGVSLNEYSSLNLGLNQADIPLNVFQNREIIAKTVGIDSTSFVFARQVHSTNVARAFESDRGRGLYSRVTAFPFTDAMVTNSKQVCLITLAADCVPILFYDPLKRAIGVAHAGWKGTVLKISQFVVNSFLEEFGSNPEDLIVGIGPSAGPCCYEIGKEVAEEVILAFGENNNVLKPAEKPDKFILDLWEANRITLISSGVIDENIETSHRCTICENHEFFSARKGDKGRFGAGIMLL